MGTTTTRDELEIMRKTLRDERIANEKLRMQLRSLKDQEKSKVLKVPNYVNTNVSAMPEISFDSYVLYKFKPFKITVKIPEQYLNSYFISNEDVYGVLNTARFRRDSPDANDFIGCQFCCPNKPILEIPTTKTEPKVLSNGEFEYVFDSCRSNCSSSRDHHKGKLVMVLQFVFGHRILSHPFTLQAREKRKHTNNSESGISEEFQNRSGSDSAFSDISNSSNESISPPNTARQGVKSPVDSKEITPLGFPKTFNGSQLPSILSPQFVSNGQITIPLEDKPLINPLRCSNNSDVFVKTSNGQLSDKITLPSISDFVNNGVNGLPPLNLSSLKIAGTPQVSPLHSFDEYIVLIIYQLNNFSTYEQKFLSLIDEFLENPMNVKIVYTKQPPDVNCFFFAKDRRDLLDILTKLEKYEDNIQKHLVPDETYKIVSVKTMVKSWEL